MPETKQSISLNGKPYVIKGTITHIPIREFSDSIRLTTQAKRSDRAWLSSWEVGWQKGIGLRRTADLSSKGVWFSTVETRFLGQVTLQGLTRTVTRAAASKRLCGMASYGGTLYAYATSPNANTRTEFWTYTKGTTTWGGATQVEAAVVGQIFQAADISVHAGLLVFLSKDDNNTLRVSTYDGTSVTNRFSLGVSTPTGNGVIIISSGGNLYEAHSGAGLLTLRKSTDNGTTWATSITTQDSSGAFGRAEYYDQNGKVALWIATANDLYMMDITNNVAFPMHVGPIFSNDITADHAQNILQVHQGRLYCVTQRTVYEFTWNGSILAQRDIGPFSTTDGFPSTFIGVGKLTGAVSCGKWLLVGAQSSSTEDGAILAYNPLDESWHCVADVASGAALDVTPIYWSPDSVLHYTTGLIVTQVMHDVDKNPITVSGFQYAASGKLWTPHQTAGLQEYNARWLQIQSDNEGMSANETIALKYGVEYANPDTTNPSITFNNTTTSGNLGSGLGVSAKVVGFEFAFARGGTNTNSPKMHEPAVYFEKVPTHRDAFRFTIDLEETARRRQDRPDNIRAEIDSLYDNVPLVALVIEKDTSYNVGAIPEWQFQTLVGQERSSKGEEQTGFVTVFFAERI